MITMSICLFTRKTRLEEWFYYQQRLKPKQPCENTSHRQNFLFPAFNKFHGKKTDRDMSAIVFSNSRNTRACVESDNGTSSVTCNGRMLRCTFQEVGRPITPPMNSNSISTKNGNNYTLGERICRFVTLSY